MSNTPATPPAPAPTKKPSRLRRDQSSLLVDAKAMGAAVKANLPAFEKADADRTVKRIDASWLSRFTSMVTAAETAVDGRAVRLGQLKATTATEHTNAKSLAEAVRAIRDDIATSYPDDAPIGRMFGVGTKIDPQKTGAMVQLAGEIANAFASAEWHARAVAAGVTEARIDELTRLRAALSGADVSQQGLFATNVDGTVEKDALLKAVSASTAYARKVAAVALKGNASALAAFVPARARAPKRVTKRVAEARAAKASALAAPTSKKKRKKKGSRAKVSERRAQVQTRAKALAASLAPGASKIVKKGTTTKSAAKKKSAAAKRGK